MPELSEKEQEAWLDGYISGLCTFAYHKDGIQYVGTTGMTLDEAIKKARTVGLWNQRYRQPSTNQGGKQ